MTPRRRERPSRVDPLLASLDARALLILARSARDPYIAPFTGPIKLGPCVVIVPRGAAPRLAVLSPMDRDEAGHCPLHLLGPDELDIPRWTRESTTPAELLGHVVSRALQLSELASGRLALAGLIGAGTTWEVCRLLAGEGWTFTSGESAIRLLRKTKSPAEVDELRRTSRINALAFRRIAELLAGTEVDPNSGELRLGGEGLRVARLRAEVARVFADHGLEQPEGGICAPGREGTVPHSPGSPERVLRAGESLIVDLYPRGSLFSDCTRTFCVGPPPAALAAAHRAVLAALELARSRASPGRLGFDVHREVCEMLGRAGFSTQISDPASTRGFVHGLGHGLGFEIHELPTFKEGAPEAEGVLEPGDVFTLEPGLYEPEGGWAVRLEDVHHLGSDGIEVLTPLPYGLDPRSWR